MTAGAEDKEDAGHEAASAVGATALDVPTGLFERARRFLLENQPLRASASAVDAAEHALSGARAERLPSLGVTADYGAIGTTLDSSHGTFTFQAVAKFNILDGGRISGDVDVR